MCAFKLDLDVEIKDAFFFCAAIIHHHHHHHYLRIIFYYFERIIDDRKSLLTYLTFYLYAKSCKPI